MHTFGREMERRGFRKEVPTSGKYRRATIRHGIELSPFDTLFLKGRYAKNEQETRRGKKHDNG